MTGRTLSYSVAALMAGGALGLAATVSAAEDLPGTGTTVRPISTGRADQNFQNFVIQIGLEQLGYMVEPYLEAQYPAMHLALGQGDADYATVHWDPLHKDYYERGGGEEALERVGHLIEGAVQGYLIDKKTADAEGIDDLGQLKDPEIAALFDSNGDGKADLTGCNPGWGCEGVIEHHLDAYELRDTIKHNQGEYFALMADTITRHNEGQPILFYTWTPLWVTAVLKPGEDAAWLDVPFSSLPDEGKDADTRMEDGRNTGFGVNAIRVLANAEFVDENPAAKRFFELATLPLDDVNAAILRVHEGEDSLSDTRRHADEWIAANQDQFDGWIEQAKEAAAQ